ncbi:MAG: hypothetical protein R3357_07860 [Burkholderiales bacterium]|nr:hypothetical protein [Burkholderiales bacterium]
MADAQSPDRFTQATRTARRRRRSLLVVALALLAGCAGEVRIPGAAPTTGRRAPPSPREFQASDLAKTDIDSAVEIFLQESLASARLLTEKLYRRNPREWRRGGHASLDAAVSRAFDAKFAWHFPELGNARGTDALQLAFQPEFGGDRVFALGVGLGSMIMQAYGNRTEFFALDQLDPQKLYNAARNIEVVAWKLATARGAGGQTLLLSNEIAPDGLQNLSFEREFGKLIAYQDSLARVIAERTNRSIRFVLQGAAIKVFLPL